MTPPLRPLIALLLTCTVAACAIAPPQTSPGARPHIEKAADLPRFSYPVQGDLASLVRDAARFMPLAQACSPAQSLQRRKTTTSRPMPLTRPRWRDPCPTRELQERSAGHPSSIVLPNLITVGTVDKAGDEAAFTSYGPTVTVRANGYLVDSDVPGGKRVALSGTSMSAPQVTNLAAKIMAVNPALPALEVIDIVKRTAEKTADGRRTLIHLANAMAAAGYRP